VKILFLYKYLTLGGCETVIRARLDGLAQHGIESEAWFLYDGAGRSIFSGLENRVHVGDPEDCFRYVSQERFDVLCTLDSEEIFPPFQAGLSSPRLIVEVHSPVMANIEYLRTMGDLPVAAYFAPSEHQAKIVRERVGKGPVIRIVPNPLRDLFVAEPRGFSPPPPRPVIAWIGRLDDLKNWTEFLDAAGILVLRGKEVEFWVVGPPVDSGTGDTLRRKAEEVGVVGHLRWLRGLDHQRVPTLLDAVRDSGGAVISTSRGESFGMTIAEAMSRRCAVVVPSRGPFSEFVRDGRSGLFYEIGSPKGAARALESLISDSERRKAFGDEGRKEVLARYAPEVALGLLARELQGLGRESATLPEVAVETAVLASTSEAELDVDPRFEEALRLRSKIEPEALDAGDIRSTWFRYALTTNLRGRDLARSLSQILGRRSWRGRRILDAGCAYGGLIRAFLRRDAKEVVGIDVDPSLLELATLNLESEDRHRYRLLQRGIEEFQPEADVTFDLIVCDNVLEHVADPEDSVRKLARLLAPEGSIYIAVPNPFSPPQIKSDPHHGLFGITLLERSHALRYFEELSAYPHYSVHRFATPEEYFSWFSAAGLSSRYAIRTTFFGERSDPEPARIGELEQQVAELSELFEEYRKDPRLSEASRQALETAFRNYCATFAEDSALAKAAAVGNGLEEFLDWYSPLVWHFLATRATHTTSVPRPVTLRSLRGAPALP